MACALRNNRLPRGDPDAGADHDRAGGAVEATGGAPVADHTARPRGKPGEREIDRQQDANDDRRSEHDAAGIERRQVDKRGQEGRIEENELGIAEIDGGAGGEAAPETAFDRGAGLS